MLVGRAVQGVGGGGIVLLNEIVVTDLVPLRQRAAYFGILGGILALGTVSGPVIGGALASNASWVSLFASTITVASRQPKDC
jgi:MFS family permease